MLSAPELEKTYERFTELADRKKNIYDQDLVSLVAEGRNSSAVSWPEARLQARAN